jgi:hypothetical protein
MATPPDEAAKAAIWELLQEAERVGVGVTFEPDAEGWRVHYVDLDDWPAYQEYNLSAGPLSNAYNLNVACQAALKPLRDHGERLAWYREKYLPEQERRKTEREGT